MSEELSTAGATRREALSESVFLAPAILTLIGQHRR
jgi:hypothetical protein